MKKEVENLDSSPYSLKNVVPSAATALTGCTYRTGSGYATASNCSVSANWSGVMIIGFVASYQATPYNGQINSLGNTTQNCRVAFCSRPTVALLKKTSNISGPAVAQVQSTVNVPAIGSWELWVRLEVDKNGGRVATA